MNSKIIKQYFTSKKYTLAEMIEKGNFKAY